MHPQILVAIYEHNTSTQNIQYAPEMMNSDETVDTLIHLDCGVGIRNKQQIALCRVTVF